MQNFYIILSDQDGNIDWRHPNELNGKSKDEIYKLISQDVPIENIVEILTAEEYDNKYVNKVKNGKNNKNVQQNISEISSEQFETGKDFFNAMLQAGTQIGENNSINKSSDLTADKKKKSKINITDNFKSNSNISNIEYNEQEQQEQQDIIQYFEEGGIKFKLENGKLYKKVWKQILLNGQKTPDGNEAVSEYRLVSSATKKLVSVDKVELQHLEWEEVKTH